LPISPLSMMRFASMNPGMKRLWKLMPSFTPAALHASIIRCASSTVVAIGLSQNTCLPARAAAIACSACCEFGVWIATAVTSGFASSSS
jgi:hypothetical protein